MRPDGDQERETERSFIGLVKCIVSWGRTWHAMQSHSEKAPWPVTGQREVGELGESTFIVVSMRRKRQGRTV